jgi:hypothetical protein
MARRLCARVHPPTRHCRPRWGWGRRVVCRVSCDEQRRTQRSNMGRGQDRGEHSAISHDGGPRPGPLSIIASVGNQALWMISWQGAGRQRIVSHPSGPMRLVFRFGSR